MHHEVQRPLEGLARQLAVAPGAAQFAVQRLGLEAAAQGHAHQVLHQHVQRRVGGFARFHPSGQRGAARGHRLHQLQRVRRHQRDAAGPARLVAAAAGALQQPRHALGAADLQHTLDRQEVHAQVQRRGRHHGLQAAGLQAGLDPLAHALVQRAVVQRDAAGPVGPRVEQQLVPGLGLRAHVGEDQRRRRALDLVDHRLQHLRAQVPAPGEAPGLVRQQRVDLQRLVEPALHQLRVDRVARAEQRAHRFVQVAERGRQAPHHELRVPAAQPRQRQLHLHAALVADELVPFVDDHHLQRAEVLARAFARQQQRQRFRRRHQRGRQAAGPGARARPPACRRCAGPRATAAPARPAAAAARARCRRPARASASARALAGGCRAAATRARCSAPSHTA